jgi:hypothetical protein
MTTQSLIRRASWPLGAAHVVAVAGEATRQPDAAENSRWRRRCKRASTNTIISRGPPCATRIDLQANSWMLD